MINMKEVEESNKYHCLWMLNCLDVPNEIAKYLQKTNLIESFCHLIIMTKMNSI